MSDPHLSAEVIKAGPPVVVTTGTLVMGLDLNEWVAILTIAYVVLQIGLLIPRYVERVRSWFGGGGK